MSNWRQPAHFPGRRPIRAQQQEIAEQDSDWDRWFWDMCDWDEYPGDGFYDEPALSWDTANGPIRHWLVARGSPMHKAVVKETADAALLPQNAGSTAPTQVPQSMTPEHHYGIQP